MTRTTAAPRLTIPSEAATETPQKLKHVCVVFSFFICFLPPDNDAQSADTTQKNTWIQQHLSASRTGLTPHGQKYRKSRRPTACPNSIGRLRPPAARRAAGGWNWSNSCPARTENPTRKALGSETPRTGRSHRLRTRSVRNLQILINFAPKASKTLEYERRLEIATPNAPSDGANHPGTPAHPHIFANVPRHLHCETPFIPDPQCVRAEAAQAFEYSVCFVLRHEKTIEYSVVVCQSRPKPANIQPLLNVGRPGPSNTQHVLLLQTGKKNRMRPETSDFATCLGIRHLVHQFCASTYSDMLQKACVFLLVGHTSTRYPCKQKRGILGILKSIVKVL